MELFCSCILFRVHCYPTFKTIYNTRHCCHTSFQDLRYMLTQIQSEYKAVILTVVQGGVGTVVKGLTMNKNINTYEVKH